MPRKLSLLTMLRSHVFAVVTDFCDQTAKLKDTEADMMEIIYSAAQKNAAKFKKLQDEITEANALLDLKDRLDTEKAAIAFEEMISQIQYKNIRLQALAPCPRIPVSVSSTAAVAAPISSTAPDAANTFRYPISYTAPAVTNPLRIPISTTATTAASSPRVLVSSVATAATSPPRILVSSTAPDAANTFCYPISYTAPAVTNPLRIPISTTATTAASSPRVLVSPTAVAATSPLRYPISNAAATTASSLLSPVLPTAANAACPLINPVSLTAAGASSSLLPTAADATCPLLNHVSLTAAAASSSLLNPVSPTATSAASPLLIPISPTAFAAAGPILISVSSPTPSAGVTIPIRTIKSLQKSLRYRLEEITTISSRCRRSISHHGIRNEMLDFHESDANGAKYCFEKILVQVATTNKSNERPLDIVPIQDAFMSIYNELTEFISVQRGLLHSAPVSKVKPDSPSILSTIANTSVDTTTSAINTAPSSTTIAFVKPASPSIIPYLAHTPVSATPSAINTAPSSTTTAASTFAVINSSVLMSDLVPIANPSHSVHTPTLALTPETPTATLSASSVNTADPASHNNVYTPAITSALAIFPVLGNTSNFKTAPAPLHLLTHPILIQNYSSNRRFQTRLSSLNSLRKHLSGLSSKKSRGYIYSRDGPPSMRRLRRHRVRKRQSQDRHLKLASLSNRPKRALRRLYHPAVHFQYCRPRFKKRPSQEWHLRSAALSNRPRRTEFRRLHHPVFRLRYCHHARIAPSNRGHPDDRKAHPPEWHLRSAALSNRPKHTKFHRSYHPVGRLRYRLPFSDVAPTTLCYRLSRNSRERVLG